MLAELLKGRVTAGIPGLTPRLRFGADALISGREKHHRLMLEALEKDTVTVAADGNHATTDFMAQIGRPMTVAQLEARLRKLNPNFVFEVSTANPNLKGVYLPAYDSTGQAVKRFVCGYENSPMPEFTVRHAKDKRVPNPEQPEEWITIQTFSKETRGWRTVLARLIREGLVSPVKVDKLFEISQGRSSKNWQTLTA